MFAKLANFITKVLLLESLMKSVLKFAAAVTTGLVATAGVAFAAPILTVPEPGSLALVLLAVAGVAVVARKGKK